MARTPKPTIEHRRDGTFRRDRHGNRADSALAIGEPQKPRGLPREASRLWDIILDGRPPEFKAACDTAMLEGMCRWFAVWKEKIKAGTYKDMVIAGMAWKHFAAAASQFGLSPAARTKLKVVGEKGDADPLAELYRTRVSSN